MQTSEARQKIKEIIGEFSEHKLKEILDFAIYLKSIKNSEEFLKMQMNSKAYSEWINPENDIYDEVFKDEIYKVNECLKNALALQ